MWYKRLGNIDSIKQLISKSLATGIEIKDCKHNMICKIGIKYKLINAPKIMHDPKQATNKAQKVLDLVH